MSTISFFIGCYTEMLLPDFGGSGKGIYAVSLHEDTGELKLMHTQFLRNPSYLTIDNGCLYAVSEVMLESEAKVSAFKIGSEHQLEFLNEQPVYGSLPCHVNSSNGQLLVACYGTGNLLSYPLRANGEIGPNSNNFKHSGKSINQERQESPHAHQVMEHPDGVHIFVPDLGVDKVKVYGFNNDNVLEALSDYDIEIPKGNGPRHMVFNSAGNMAYVMNELSGKIAVLKKNSETFECVALFDSLPSSFNEVPSGAAIRIHPNGQFLYIGNRTIDAITIFKIEGEALEVIDYQHTNGTTLREFNVSPDGKWLIACLQDSNEVISYKILESGLLEEKSRTTDIISPVCVCF